MKKLLAASALAALIAFPALGAEKVTVDNFVVAETHNYMKAYADQGGFGQLLHIRLPTPLDKQDVIRMNRDTLYSVGVFDLTTPVTITKPDTNGRFQSMLVINEEHSMLPVEHGSGVFTLTKEDVGSRYVVVVFRTFVDPNNPDDIAAANAAQDAIKIEQDDVGKLELPDWDEASLDTVRAAINVLAATKSDTSGYFGDRSKLNPIDHLMGTAAGWGGNPKEAAMYVTVTPEKNDGVTTYTLNAKDVPVDGFASVTVYNKDGFMQANDSGVVSYNNVTATPNEGGGYTINFGGCDDPARINCIPITEGWNYTVRLYQPKQALLDGSWTFPDAVPN